LETKTPFKLSGHPLIIGHRGAAGHAAENTLESFRKALALNADMVEFDVRLTADRRTVIMHDDTVNRTTDGAGRVDRMTFAAFRRLRCANGRPPPSFEETLKLLWGKVPLNIEIKGPGCARAVCPRFRGRNISDTLFSSFEWEELYVLRNILPHAFIGLLYETPVLRSRLFRHAARLRAVSIHPSLPLTTPALVRACHARGLRVVPWTASTEKEIRRCLRMKTDGFFTDYPDRALSLVSRRLQRDS
jgi:glycerophosphoryl diester phosphodiesterase